VASLSVRGRGKIVSLTAHQTQQDLAVLKRCWSPASQAGHRQAVHWRRSQRLSSIWDKDTPREGSSSLSEDRDHARMDDRRAATSRHDCWNRMQFTNSPNNDSEGRALATHDNHRSCCLRDFRPVQFAPIATPHRAVSPDPVEHHALLHRGGNTRVGTCFLCSLLFRTQLIPRSWRLGGFIGYVSLTVGMIAEIFGSTSASCCPSPDVL